MSGSRREVDLISLGGRQAGNGKWKQDEGEGKEVEVQSDGGDWLVGGRLMDGYERRAIGER